MAGRKVLIVGIASKKSIAWGIAEAMHREGAELAFTYQNEKLKSRVEEVADFCGSKLVFPCDVTDDAQMAAVMAGLGGEWSRLDGLVHSVAFAPREELEGDFDQAVTREGFRVAHEISAYSLPALVKAAGPLLTEGSSVLAMTYLGAVRAVPNYNVMGLAKASLEAGIRYLAYAMGPRGVRVNGISAGPIRTLAASGIGGFRSMLEQHAQTTPLRRNVTIEEVGNAAAFLCSDLASGITGEITYVDCGYNIVAL